jgi:hypothetical protein
MKTNQERDLWTLIRSFDIMPDKITNVWIVRVDRRQWHSETICTWVETGGVFAAGMAGVVTPAGEPSENMLLRFRSVEGDGRLEVGFHMKLGR